MCSSDLAGMQSGWHALASNSTSGAIDYVRSGFLQDRLIGWPLERAATTLQRRATGLPSYEWRSWADRGANSVLTTLDRVSARLPLWPLRARPWIRSNGDNALSTLEAELPGSSRIYIFGDHYRTGLGVHDVHMNQGDPAGSQWWATDGIWQDGAVFVEKPSGTLFGWQVKFNSQSMRTDSAGHPV